MPCDERYSARDVFQEVFSGIPCPLLQLLCRKQAKIFLNCTVKFVTFEKTEILQIKKKQLICYLVILFEILSFCACLKTDAGSKATHSCSHYCNIWNKILLTSEKYSSKSYARMDILIISSTQFWLYCFSFNFLTVQSSLLCHISVLQINMSSYIRSIDRKHSLCKMERWR